MSRKGTKLEYLPDMEQDLMNTFRKVSREGTYQQMEAFERTIASPARRFYVSERRAYQVVLKLFKNDTREIDRMTPLKRKMFLCIFNKTKKMMEQREYASLSLHFIIPIVVGSQAPCSFVSIYTMRRIYYSRNKA